MSIAIYPEKIPSNVPTEAVEDYRNHLFYTFKALGLGEPTPLQYIMAYRLQHGEEMFQLMAGRGAGKSVLTACFASWLLLRNPDTTIMVLSATAIKATEFVSMTRKILSLVPYMKHLEPGDQTRDSAFGFNVESRKIIGQDLSCFARGISSQLTGSHADWCICDDVEIGKNSESAAARDRLLLKVGEVQQILNPNKGGVRILGTPQSMDSVYLKLEDAYPVHAFPAIMPDPDDEAKCKNLDELMYDLEVEVGESTQPERFSMDLLMQRKARIGPRQFSLHYELDTKGADEDKYPLRLSDLIVMEVDPNAFPTKVVWGNLLDRKDIGCYGIHGDLIYQPVSVSQDFSEYAQTCAFLDPSGRGADETTLCIASFVNGYIVIHELIGFSGGYDPETLENVCKIVQQYDIKQVRFEANYGDAMFGSLLAPVLERICGRNVGLEEYKVVGAKEKRMMDVLEPAMSQHRIVFNTKAIRERETQIQITRLTVKRGCLKHDDRVDVLHAAVAYWSDSLALTVDKIIERNERDAYEERIEAWKDDTRRADELIIGTYTSGAARPVGGAKKRPLPNILKTSSRNSWR